MKKISTTQRLENAIEHQPDRYIVSRNEKQQLVEVIDKDTGRLWKRLNQGWIWID